ncbi:MAG: alpha amylase N-terminal ig-like domain-containing protein, partial [Planctomycetota bacterium]|nr:alpha amylase N-terminal ig-like domain-containing protein [Planctomycetota bacterium]
MAEAIVKQRVKSKRAYRVLFRYQPVIAVKSVHLAGTFNGWRVDSTPMSERGHSGVYEVEIELPFGKHEYKFVLNGGTWLQDASNSETQPDGNGGFNSVVHVGRKPASSAGQVGDGKLSAEDLIHDPRSLSFASAVDGDRRLILRVHVLKNDVKSVQLERLVSRMGGSGISADPMRKIATVAGRDVYEARLFFGKKVPGVVRYRFLIDDGGKKPFVFGKNGLGGARFQLVMAGAGRFETPDWVRDAIF